MWGVVSSKQKHREQRGSHGQFFLAMLYAMSTLSCNTSQLKNLHFGSVEAFQIDLAINLDIALRN
jgi:hypothetical protein